MQFVIIVDNRVAILRKKRPDKRIEKRLSPKFEFGGAGDYGVPRQAQERQNWNSVQESQEIGLGQKGGQERGGAEDWDDHQLQRVVFRIR